MLIGAGALSEAEGHIPHHFIMLQLYTYDKKTNVVQKRTVKDGHRYLVQYAYDASDNVTETVEDANNLHISTKSIYDLLGRLIKLTDANGNATRYAHDYADRILREEYADKGTIMKQYDPAGRLVRRTDQNGDSIIYTYNKVNLPVQKKYGAKGEQQFVYDSGYRLVSTRDNNGSDDPERFVQTWHTYDNLNRSISEAIRVGSAGKKTVQRRFDRYGHVIGMTYPNGRRLEFSYTGVHQVDKIQLSSDSGKRIVLADYDYQY